MTKWEGIEDSSTAAVPVWLSRGNKDTIWKPLWKSDCQQLNRLTGNETAVHLECGRKTANLRTHTLKSNFVPRCPVEALCSAIWFKRHEKNKEVTLIPITEDFDTMAIETLYQRAVEATSTLGKGLSQALLDERPVMKDGQTKVKLYKTGETLSLRLVPPGSWLFTSEITLQRGYGAYEAPGEEIELSLGPVRHVIFVVHGIGEAFFSREEIKVWGLIEQTQAARIEIQQKQIQSFSKDAPVKPNRIEIIPVEWFSRVHDESNDLMKSLRATTLTTIPALRAIANDVVFDILMYLTPAFCSQVLETVTEQICDMYRVFCDIHPDFLRNGGTITLAGHSLGSVICWDLLAVLKEHLEGSASDTVKSAFATGGWGPPISVPKYLPFQPDHTIFLGSPLGMFLSLRGAHPALDAIKKTDQKVSSFTLPTRSLYNIFHPSDPVAYRIEPLLYPRDYDADDIPEALYLTTPGDDVRLHIKAKQLKDVVRKTFFNPKEKGWGALIDGAVALAKESVPAKDNGESNDSTTKPKSISFPLGGSSPRVDFSLQPYIIDNEYISAVTAHSSYFQNSDFQSFLIGMLGQASNVKTTSAEQTQTSVTNLSPAFG